jgi:putative NADPH-quinone reductase
MKVLVISGNPKKSGALAALTEEAARGAAENGAEVEWVRLREKDIGFCRFCLKCQQDRESPIAPCVQDDDMTEILQEIKEADGFIMASPLSSAHANAIMKMFIERSTWPLWRVREGLLGKIPMPEARLDDKQRYTVKVTTAGAIPAWLGFIFNGAAREMGSFAKWNFNSKIAGRLFVGLLYLLGLSDKHKRKAYELGTSLTDAIRTAA